MTERVLVLVDGFNLYYGLRDKYRHKYLWLDVEAVANRLIKQHQHLTEVVYFTARVRDQPVAQKRQSTYLDALRTRQQVRIVEGRYQEKRIRCNTCGDTWTTYEEKESDVNIAVTLLSQTAKDSFDTALVVSADSDLCPAVRAAQKLDARKRIVAVFPPKRHSEELRKTASGPLRLSTAIVRQSQLEDPVVGPQGRRFKRPAKWT